MERLQAAGPPLTASSLLGLREQVCLALRGPGKDGRRLCCGPVLCYIRQEGTRIIKSGSRAIRCGNEALQKVRMAAEPPCIAIGHFQSSSLSTQHFLFTRLGSAGRSMRPLGLDESHRSTTPPHYTTFASQVIQL